jgi:sugar/nucleoside kinase (ribokinase family)
MPNQREVCEMMGDSDAERAIQRLAKLVPLLVVKLGERGAMAIKGGRRCESDAISVKSVDAVGAGDSFNAGFLHGFVKGWQLHRCLRFGNLTGAFSTTAQGGVQAFRDRAQLDKFLSENLPPDMGVPTTQAER